MTVAPQHRTAKRKPTLSYGDYLRFSKLMEERFGLIFPEKRRTDLEMGLRQAFAASTCTDMDEYYHLLQSSDGGGVEMDRLVNALTVGETYFFRDAGQFDALYQHVLPQIIERRRPLRTLRIWSAGCASGEEPYSVAMMLRDLLPDVDEWSVTVLGTDINTEALDRARQAVYGNWSFREERARQWRRRFFRRQGTHYELIPEVKRMVTFGRLNLVDDVYPTYRTNTTYMDLILCRNVTIYFTPSALKRVVGRLYEALANEGWLVAGHSEVSYITYHRFQARTFPNAILYQRTGEPTALPQDWEGLVAAAKGDEPAAAAVSVSAPPAGPVTVPPFDQPALSGAGPGTVEGAEGVGKGRTRPPTGTAGADRPVCRPEATEGDPLEQAWELLSYGRSEEARDLLLARAQATPEHAPTCALLGRAYANLGNWSEAERWCRQAIRQDKLTLGAYYTLALVLQHQERLDDAINAMKKVVYLDRHHVLGHFGLADLYRSHGQLPQALKSLDNARRLLTARSDDELIPDSGGVTAGRLRETITRQQQQWGAGASGSGTKGSGGR